MCPLKPRLPAPFTSPRLSLIWNIDHCNAFRGPHIVVSSAPCFGRFVFILFFLSPWIHHDYCHAPSRVRTGWNVASWLHHAGDVLLVVASWTTWATSSESRHQPRPCHIHLHSKLTRRLRCVRICACCAWVFYAGAVRTSCNGDRVFRPQLCVTDRWPCWPPVCTLSERSPGCQAVTSTYTREQFLSPAFFTKKKPPLTSSFLLLFFCHCAIQISLSPPTLAGSKRGDAESREYSLF